MKALVFNGRAIACHDTAVIEDGQIVTEAGNYAIDPDHPDSIQIIDAPFDVTGYAFQGGEFVPVVTEAPRAKVSPVEFKLLFKAQERVAIKTSADLIVQDFFEIVNDPRLTFVDLQLQSTKDALAYLTSLNLIGPGRMDAILTGIVQ